MLKPQEPLTSDQRERLSRSTLLSRQQRRAVKFKHHAKFEGRLGGVVTAKRMRGLAR